MRPGIGFACVIAFPALAAAAPEDRGPHPFAMWNVGDVAVAGASLPTVVFYPEDAAAPLPLVAVIHGFTRSGAYHVELASTLASQGLVVVVPDMPCRLDGLSVDCDHDANAAQITALLDWAAAQSEDDTTPLFGIVDGSRRGVIGHSWGGLAVFLAGARATGLTSVVTLDPNDDAGMAEAEAGSMGAPYAEIRAEVPGACNDAWTDTTFADVPPPKVGMVIAGAGHCDAEEPGDSACPFLCGEGDPLLSRFFRRYAVAWTTCNLLADPAVQPWIGGSAWNEDVASGLLLEPVLEGIDPLPCLAGGDADSDADTDSDSDADSDADSDSDTSKDEGGCGCRVPPSPLGIGAAPWVAIALVARRRRVGATSSALRRPSRRAGRA